VGGDGSWSSLAGEDRVEQETASCHLWRILDGLDECGRADA
jgi:hypothetical protein